MAEIDKLPEGWKWVRLCDVGKIISGGTPSTSMPEYWNGDINWIAPSDLTGYKKKTIGTGAKSISALGLQKSSAKLMPKGSVLFSSRAPIGYVAIASEELSTNQGFKSIIPNPNVDSDFLYYFLKASKQAAENAASGTTFKEISLTSFSHLKFPLPPLNDQKAIVSKIEELFSELDKGIEDLKLAQQQLKVYRQSVLKYAFEGKLTNDNVKDGELPEGWKLMSIKELSSLLGDGLHGTPQYDEAGEYFFINGNNLNNGIIEIKSNTKKVSHQEYVKYKKNLTENTVFVSINGTIGYTAFYNSEPVVLGKSVCYFNVNDDIDKHYIRYVLTTENFKLYCLKAATGSTIKNVSLKSMREFKVPLPASFNEQKKIVQQIENRLSVADKLESNIIESLEKAEALRQGILKKAYSGELIAEVKPVEVPRINNEYFHQLQLVALVINGSKKKKIDHGEMTLAKNLYLLDSIYNIPTGFKYDRWHLGPYPPALKKIVNNKEYFTRADNYIEVQNEEKLLKYNNLLQDQITTAIDDLSSIFSKYKGAERSHKTELLATVCKVIKDIKCTDLAAVRESMQEWKIELKNSKFMNKAEKFKEPETKKCIEFIVERGWDRKLIKS